MNIRDVPVVGNFLGDIFGEESDSEKASKQQQRLFNQFSQQYTAEREPMRQARMQALQQSLSLFNPMNNLMEEYYGPSARLDFSQVLKNPMQNYEQKVKTNLGKVQQSSQVESLNNSYSTLLKMPNIGAVKSMMDKLKNQAFEQSGGKIYFNERTQKFEETGSLPSKNNVPTNNRVKAKVQ